MNRANRVVTFTRPAAAVIAAVVLCVAAPAAAQIDPIAAGRLDAHAAAVRDLNVADLLLSLGLQAQGESLEEVNRTLASLAPVCGEEGVHPLVQAVEEAHVRLDCLRAAAATQDRRLRERIAELEKILRRERRGGSRVFALERWKDEFVREFPAWKGEVSAAITALQTGLHDQGEVIRLLEGRLTAVEQLAASLESRMNGLEGRVTALERRPDRRVQVITGIAATADRGGASGLFEVGLAVPTPGGEFHFMGGVGKSPHGVAWSGSFSGLWVVGASWFRLGFDARAVGDQNVSPSRTDHVLVGIGPAAEFKLGLETFRLHVSAPLGAYVSNPEGGIQAKFSAGGVLGVRVQF